MLKSRPPLSATVQTEHAVSGNGHRAVGVPCTFSSSPASASRIRRPLLGLLAVKLLVLWVIYRLWFAVPMPDAERLHWLGAQVYGHVSSGSPSQTGFDCTRTGPTSGDAPSVNAPGACP